MRHLGIIDFDLIGRLTFADYDIIIDAINQRLEDSNQDMHWQAYLSSIATERDEKGRPRFPNFKAFYKHKEVKQDSRFDGLKNYMRNKHE